jgi:hypothetical protein
VCGVVCAAWSIGAAATTISGSVRGVRVRPGHLARRHGLLNSLYRGRFLFIHFLVIFFCLLERNASRVQKSENESEDLTHEVKDEQAAVQEGTTLLHIERGRS